MCCHVLEQAVLQGCKQVFGVFRPRQVVPPAPKQALECGPRLAPRLDSLAPGASPMRHSKWLPVTCCPVSYSNTRQSFNPEYYRLVQAASNIIPNRPRGELHFCRDSAMFLQHIRRVFAPPFIPVSSAPPESSHLTEDLRRAEKTVGEMIFWYTTTVDGIRDLLTDICLVGAASANVKWKM